MATTKKAATPKAASDKPTPATPAAKKVKASPAAPKATVWPFPLGPKP